MFEPVEEGEEPGACRVDVVTESTVTLVDAVLQEGVEPVLHRRGLLLGPTVDVVLRRRVRRDVVGRDGRVDDHEPDPVGELGAVERPDERAVADAVVVEMDVADGIAHDVEVAGHLLGAHVAGERTASGQAALEPSGP